VTSFRLESFHAEKERGLQGLRRNFELSKEASGQTTGCWPGVIKTCRQRKTATGVGIINGWEGWGRKDKPTGSTLEMGGRGWGLKLHNPAT